MALAVLGVIVIGIFLCLISLLVLVKTGVLVAMGQDVIAKAKIVEARADEKNVARAIASYQVDFPIYLAGDAPLILAALRGDNPRKIVYFETAPRRLAANGALLDPWGTPYQIAVAELWNTPPPFAGESCIRSAGPDKVFDESKSSDDIVNGR